MILHRLTRRNKQQPHQHSRTDAETLFAWRSHIDDEPDVQTVMRCSCGQLLYTLEVAVGTHVWPITRNEADQHLLAYRRHLKEHHA